MDARHRDGFTTKEDEPAPPGISDSEYKLPEELKTNTPSKPLVSSKGIENAKKRLRAFSIQKRGPITPAQPIKASGSGTSAVLIGRLNSIKPSRFAPLEDDPKKPPKPPKPGSGRKYLQESYSELQKKTLSEIEDMKRKMELVELGIPLGLICPGVVNDKAMPTKAMPPIKTLLDPAKVDEIIREAKKAQREGKEYKFDYHKLLPDYDNPFQRKKEDSLSEDKEKFDKDKSKDKEIHKRDSHWQDSRKHSNYDRDGRHRRRSKERSRSTPKDKSNVPDVKPKDKSSVPDVKTKDREHSSDTNKNIAEASVNLKDYLVCDSWSLDDKTNSSSPKVDDITKESLADSKDKTKQMNSPLIVKSSPLAAKSKNSPLLAKRKNSPLVAKQNALIVPTTVKVKLQPVIDSFKFEIDEDNDDDVLDITEDVEDIPLPPRIKDDSDPVKMKIFDDVEDTPSCDGMDDDTFLESVINEIKGGNIDEEYTHEKSLVEYDISPVKDEDSKDSPIRSVTPELDDSMRELQSSRHSNYSDGYRSTESGYKSTESGYKSTDSDFKSSKSNEVEKANEKLKESEKAKDFDDHKKKNERKKDKTTEKKSSNRKSSSNDSEYSSSSHEYNTNTREYKSSTRERKSSKSECNSRAGTSSENYRMSMEKDDDTSSMKMSKYTLDSLETWSFVLKFCQPLLFRHDADTCFKETRTMPKLWFAEAPKQCPCVEHRSVVYNELYDCKMALVDRVYGCDQISDLPFPSARTWYPRAHVCLAETTTVPIAVDWEADDVSIAQSKHNEKSHSKDASSRVKKQPDTVDSRNDDKVGDGKLKDKFDVEPLSKKDEARSKASRARRSTTPLLNDEISLDREYQKFMEAVWPGVDPPATRSTTPTQDLKKKVTEDTAEDKKRGKKMKLCSDGWSQESEQEEEPVSKKQKTEKALKGRKRKHSASDLSDGSHSEETPKKKKKADRKKEKKKLKSKLAKRRRTEKKRLKKIREKQKKKKSNDSPDVAEKDIKKELKKSKKKKQLKLKKKIQKKRKSKKKSSSSDTISDSSNSGSSSESESSSESSRKAKKDDKRRKREKKRRKSTSESTQSDEELFDANILNNIKKELTDEEKLMKKPREIINVKELQNDFVGNNIHIKQEIIEEESSEDTVISEKPDQIESSQIEKEETTDIGQNETQMQDINITDIPLPQKIPVIDENLSQSSSQASQESVCSVKEPNYEKDDSHLRPSSQNSNYSFNGVIASGNGLYNKAAESENECGENYEPENYEVYEQMALAYQNDVANQPCSGASPSVEQRIETVVRRGAGEIKCDWRAGEAGGAGGAGAAGIGGEGVPRRPSRWGLKPGDVNIVLTGGNSEQNYSQTAASPVYKIESLANRNNENSSLSYDEAYMDTYGASDRLQYGDCFADPTPTDDKLSVENAGKMSLDDRIDLALRNSVLGEVARDPDDDKENKDRNKNARQTRVKSVSFADGYKPGQDSDVEDPPKKKRGRRLRRGCAWPCPAGHPDHVPLWDALPPPPPPTEPYPGTVPPPLPPLLAPRVSLPPLGALLHHAPTYDPGSALPGFMPPEPPSGLINFN